MAESDPIFQRNLTRVAKAGTDREFTVVSYNILCDEVFDKNPQLYSYLPKEMKCRGPVPKNSARHTQLLKELHWLDADVVCLQEVDPFYFPYLVKSLATRGYQGFFQPHISKDDADGVATFFKTDTFQLNDYKVFGFNEKLDEMVELDKFENRNEHNQRVGQYTVLKDLKSGKEVVIANIHLIFNFWREPDVHAIQAAIFFQQLYAVLPQSSKHSTAWIVCGDFNMQPHFPAYEMIKKGQLSESSIQKLRPGKYKYPSLTENQEVEQRNTAVHKHLRNKLSHPFKYPSSAYKAVLGSEPKFTHYECDDVFPEVFGFDMMKDTLDYIWFSSDLLQANAVLEMVDEEVIKPFGACPNRYFPSDHLALKACFQFIDNVDSAYSSGE